MIENCRAKKENMPYEKRICRACFRGEETGWDARDKEIAALKEKVRSMKCAGNCKNTFYPDNCPFPCHRIKTLCPCDKWELREKE